MRDFVVVIPARYQSSRLPGKPLIDLHGKSLLLRTYEQCCKAVGKSLVYVATDDERIYKYCLNHNIKVEMTSVNCLTGTDRVAEFAQKIIAKSYINVQGDEPLLNPEDIKQVINAVIQFPDDIINGYAPIETVEQYNSLTIPKVVFRADKRLLYMSRSPIPGNKSGSFQKSWRQICVYGFPRITLTKFAEQTGKSPLEKEEDIEILRFLELGYEVRMLELSSDSVAVDTLSDAEKVREILEQLDENK